MTDTILIGRTLEDHQVLHGITHAQAWGWVGLTTAIAAMIYIDSGETAAIASPIALLILFATLSSWKGQQDAEDEARDK